jgi:catechol 2,3-dioxygenase-like lactoylglutathione lyase family enzyme|tara:strand:+ start:20176 stop:20577 length:402 start_codon:yes stop_codon:yes gene_type:complete
MKIWLHHINICGHDVAGLDQFYQEVFSLGKTENEQITSDGYNQSVAFLTDGTTEFHLATQDLGVSYRTKQPVNPLERGHIAFRTDDIEAFKDVLEKKGIPFADYGVWAVEGWYQVFFQDPAGTIIEVHQIDYK